MEYLFIVDTLAQHGAERYLFEIVKSLKSRGHEIKVLSFFKLNNQHDFYVNKLIENHINVKTFEFKIFKNKFLNRITLSLLRRLRLGMFNKLFNEKLVTFLKNHNNIFIIKWDVYLKYNDVFQKLEKINICIMSGLIQYSQNPYLNLPINKTVFYIFYKEQENEILGGRIFSNITFKFVPLLIDNEKSINRYCPSNREFRIGIFSRINTDQPTLFALFILHLLKTKAENYSLYFFGRVYDQNYFDLMKQTINYLKINNSVFFYDHTIDLPGAIENYNLNIGLMNCNLKTKGYSSIELESAGLPIIYFDINENIKIDDKENLIFSDLIDIVNTISDISTDTNYQKKLSEHTFNKSKDDFGISRNINFIKEFE